jgi:hypothetical protein
MRHDHELTDRAADIALAAPQLLAKGYRGYWRYHATIKARTHERLSRVRTYSTPT